MTTTIMTKWLQWFDKHISSRSRKVVLLIDNFSAYTAAV